MEATSSAAGKTDRDGGLDVSESRRLKKLLAESMLNEAALRNLLGEKWYS